MNLTLRQERLDDYEKIAEVIEAAFEPLEFSDHKEHLLVERLRNSEAYIPQLSIVAELGDEIVGHILLTKIRINSLNHSFGSLALAPVSVKPAYQGKGIGEMLIRKSHQIARNLGYQSVVLLGHAAYYPKFGYEMTSKYGIELPFDVPKENCMVISLVEGGLQGVVGKVEYAKEFYE